MREALSSLDAAAKAAASEKIRAQVRRHPLLQQARVLYGFAPMAAEPDWLGDIWPEKQIVVFPSIENGVMRFFAAGGHHELKPGAFGIAEPVIKIPAPPPDAALIPGLAFDAHGGRLGRGRGFYDRFLASIPHVPIVGVCFSCQLVPHIPMEEHDARVGAIITEQGVIAP